MRVVLLGAGLGTRIAAVTRNEVPKLLVPIAGEPLLSRQLHYLERQGVEAVAVNIHHLRDRVLEFLDRFETSLEIRISIEETLMGTAGALLPLMDFLIEPFILLYGDVVTDTDISALLGHHHVSGAVATLGYYESEELEGKGVLHLDDSGTVVAFDEKARGLTGRRAVNAGLAALDPATIEFVRPGADFGYDVWPAMLRAGVKLASHRIDGYVADIGEPEVLARVEADVRAGNVAW